MAALAFIPPADVIEGYELLDSTNYYDCHSDMSYEFLSYFESTWIGKSRHNKNKRDKPRFSIKLWNCYGAVIRDQLRSNNSREGWHNRFNRRVNTCHASIRLFLNAMKDEQVKTETLITQINTGLDISTRRRAYCNYDDRLKNVVIFYNANDKLDYLKIIAKIISLNNAS
ncbi:uncharacterized protein [Chelonus insularis]|uniref:uncharacterized protein n=1 Tax=Chelonus insularis TaxID=460826 RepID=UPI00158998A4|nr:uncharacterized protein LOC118071247 [Chelonus insularis]